MKKQPTIEISKEKFDGLADFLLKEKNKIAYDLDFTHRSNQLHSQEAVMVHYFTGRKVELLKQHGLLVEILQALHTLTPDQDEKKD